MLRWRHPTARSTQRGLSIVELMVGITIGLIIVAAASLLMTGQLVENRRLLTETQLQQDLRAAADIIARELRRSGAMTQVSALSTVWYPEAASSNRNLLAASLNASSSQVDFNYDPGAFQSGPYGFKLENGVIKTRLFGAGWQDLTDANVMTVQSFTPQVVDATTSTTKIPCPKLCSNGTTDCWPSYQVREVTFEIRAVAKRDPTVLRSVSGRVRVRGDRVLFTDWSANQICPP